MKQGLKGKVALITGGASGIGRSCAERLAAEGAHVVITDLQDDRGRALAAAVAATGASVQYLTQDVTSERAWGETIEILSRDYGKLDILVNNAGIALGCSVIEMTLEDWRRQTAVNLDGVFLGTKHALPLMRESGAGSIINMSSVAGLKGSANLAGYCATKAGVRLFTKAVALECAAAGDGIRVNSVHPGIIETEIWDTIGFGGLGVSNSAPARSATLDQISEQAVPLRIKGSPIDVASAVAWLASDESSYVTGAEIVVDGGLSIR